MTRKLYYIRPDHYRPWKELFRYAGGEWVPDDGERDLSFVGKDSFGFPFAYGAELSPLAYSDHPNEQAMRAAMDHGVSLYHCCNGRRVKRK